MNNFILGIREFWIYHKLRKKFSRKEISKLNITVTSKDFTYAKNKNKLEFNGETFRFPNILYLLIWNFIKILQNKEKITFKRTEAKGMDMMFLGPAVPGQQTYVYNLKIE